MIQYIFPDQDAVVHNAKTWKFPAREVGVSLTCGSVHRSEVWVEASMRNSDELIELCMFFDAIRRKYWDIRIVVRILSLDLISFILVDPHSFVSPALIKKAQILGMKDVWKGLYKSSQSGNNDVV